MEIISAALVQLLIALVTVGVGFLITYLKNKIGTEKLNGIKEQIIAKKELAILAVKFAEQAFNHLESEAKYNEAAKWLSKSAGEIGLKISEEEIKGLIESALRQIKDELGENWGSKK